MKPAKSILDRSFVYIPSSATSVDQTWRRFGWRPAAEEAGRSDERREARENASTQSYPVVN